MRSLAPERRSQSTINTIPVMTDPSLVQILASASYDDTIKLYLDDPSDDWFCAATLSGHGSTVWALAWEPEQGQYLASGSDDHTIRIWRRLPGQGELKFQCIAVLEGHDRSVYSTSWTKAPLRADKKAGTDGQRNLGWIASTGGDGTIFVWELTVSPRAFCTCPLLTASQELDGSQESPRLTHSIIARVDAAHGVHDLNTIAWCPRPGMEGTFATAGDDGHVKVWKVQHTEAKE